MQVASAYSCLVSPPIWFNISLLEFLALNVGSTVMYGVNCSVSLASHDGSSEFGVLCGDLASGKGANLDLSYFRTKGSATELALLNGFHVEIFGER